MFIDKKSSYNFKNFVSLTIELFNNLILILNLTTISGEIFILNISFENHTKSSK